MLRRAEKSLRPFLRDKESEMLVTFFRALFAAAALSL
jgi:hypothetical protein